jgi:hypothetical protein
MRSFLSLLIFARNDERGGALPSMRFLRAKGAVSRPQSTNREVAGGSFPLSETIHIFFSLAPAPQDATLFEQLRKHLSALKRQGLIEL